MLDERLRGPGFESQSSLATLSSSEFIGIPAHNSHTYLVENILK